MSQSNDLLSAAMSVLTHRNGELPAAGWLADNDASRRDLDALQKAVTARLRGEAVQGEQQAVASPHLTDEQLRDLVQDRFHDFFMSGGRVVHAFSREGTAYFGGNTSSTPVTGDAVAKLIELWRPLCRVPIHMLEAALAQDRASQAGAAGGALSADWRPIESAPDDVRIICAWLGAPGCSEVDVACRFTDHNEGAPYWCSPTDRLERYGVPDLWQPFPTISDDALTAMRAAAPPPAAEREVPVSGDIDNRALDDLESSPDQRPVPLIREAEAHLREINAANLVPGCVRCAKCGFQLQRTTLYTGNGATAPGDNKTEPCPNGCGPLWPITWEQEARDSWRVCQKQGMELMDIRNALRACVPALQFWQARAGLGEIAESIVIPMQFKKTGEAYTKQFAEAERLLNIIAVIDGDAPTDPGENNVS